MAQTDKNEVESSKILITDQPLQLEGFSDFLNDDQGEDGAVVHFIGKVRSGNEEQGLQAMSLEHYPGMTEKQLAALIEKARNRWPVNRALIAHRIGMLYPGDPIVFVGVSSAHRQAAFSAASFIMDYLKVEATFWKKEFYQDEENWVAAKEGDQHAAEQWD